MFRLASLVIALACLSLVACASRPGSAPYLADESPADFTMSVTVRSPRVGALPRALRQGRYILEPGGTLRAAVGPGADDRTYPSRAADLGPIEIERIWRLVRDSGLLDGASPYAIATPGDAWGSPTRVMAVVYVVTAERRATYAVPLEDPSPVAQNVWVIVDRLARLAGVPE